MHAHRFRRWLRPRPIGAGLLIAAASGPSDGGVFTEFGDAPEGTFAYPWIGVAGRFPTCEFGGPAGYIKHFHPGMPMMAPLHLGPDADPEFDGNGGICPPPPYDQDECDATTGDAGLSRPDAWTTDLGLPNPIPCSGTASRALGSVCEVLEGSAGSWFEGTVTNDDLLDEAYLNVLIDWNQDGEWNGSVFCGPDQVDEHVFKNVVIPPGYSGFLSGLPLPNIHVGPNAGHVWMRMTVTPKFPAVPEPWDGTGEFDSGETEDYLIEITEGASASELGDAPEGAPAYPSGTPGSFPTCRFVGPSGYILHNGPTLAFFGSVVDTEPDGNDGQCPPGPYDLDECFGGPDAGLIVPEPATFGATGGVTTCGGGTVVPQWQACTTLTWGPDLDIEITNNAANDRYLSVLADWNGNGAWGDSASACGVPLSERVVINALVPGGHSGPASGLGLPDFSIGAPPEGLAWLRFSITEEPVKPDWRGNGVYFDGETEDYLIPIEIGAVDVDAGASAITPRALQIASIRPNPMRAETEIALVTAGGSRVDVVIYDVSGRRVRGLELHELVAGRHTLTWDGRTDDGRDAAAGTYFVRVRSGDVGDTRRLVLVR